MLLRKVSFCVLDISWLQAGGDSPASAFQELSHHEQQKEILVKMPQRQSVCSFCVRHYIRPQLYSARETLEENRSTRNDVFSQQLTVARTDWFETLFTADCHGTIALKGAKLFHSS